MLNIVTRWDGSQGKWLGWNRDLSELCDRITPAVFDGSRVVGRFEPRVDSSFEDLPFPKGCRIISQMAFTRPSPDHEMPLVRF